MVNDEDNVDRLLNAKRKELHGLYISKNKPEELISAQLHGPFSTKDLGAFNDPFHNGENKPLIKSEKISGRVVLDRTAK